MRLTIFFFLIITAISNINAQNKTSAGVLPKTVISVKLPKNLKLVNIIELREVFFEKTDGSDVEFNYNHKLTDISALISLKRTPYKSFALGYRMRAEGNNLSHQIIQQFSVVQNLNASRVGHRLSADQTFKSDIISYRFRYRLSFEKPLNGNKIDPNEFYIKAGTEYLMKLSDNITSSEIRAVSLLGYEIEDSNKIEIGLDYRISNFLNKISDNAIWLNIGWYFKI